METAFSRIAADLSARYVIKFDPSAREDGGFHSIEVRVKRKGAIVRAPTGYWAPFATSRFTRPLINRADYLRTPHSSGLIQTWLRMEPGTSGRTRVTFAWAPRPAGARAATVNLEAVSFEGDKLHAASSVAPVGSSVPGAAAEVSFDAPPGPIQLAMAIQGQDTLLATDVRYIDVLRFDSRKPVIAAIEFLRPGSPAQFEVMQGDPLVMPIEARDFFKYDRLLLRVRAYSGQEPADVRVRLLDRSRSEVLRLPVLASVGGASQFDLPLTPYPRGEYYLDVRATAGGLETDRLLSIRLTR
jgi:hypothetical protein